MHGGGGGNFGVAASLEYRLHPLQQIFGGLVAHPFPAAKDVLRFYRDSRNLFPMNSACSLAWCTLLMDLECPWLHSSFAMLAP